MPIKTPDPTIRASRPQSDQSPGLFGRLRGGVATAIRAVNTHAKPLVTVASRVGEVLQIAADPSPVVVLGAVSRAITDMEEWANFQKPVETHQTRPFREGVVWDALLDWAVAQDSVRATDTGFSCRFRDETLVINRADRFVTLPGEKSFEALFQVIDGLVPRRMEMGGGYGNDDVIETELTEIGLHSPRADEILTKIAPTLDRGSGRVVLLHGPPGEGKSCAALWLADHLSRSRIIRLSSNGVTHRYTQPDRFPFDVVIIDDVDKAPIQLDVLEHHRRTSRLVIMTANNAMDDRVIDGAAIRCGRVDEGFVVNGLGKKLEPEPPLDLIDKEQFERIRAWPASALAEVRIRILTRGVDPDDLRLGEIEERLGMKCHSVKRRAGDGLRD